MKDTRGKNGLCSTYYVFMSLIEGRIISGEEGKVMVAWIDISN